MWPKILIPLQLKSYKEKNVEKGGKNKREKKKGKEPQNNKKT
jgi:hypothetical protein